MINRQELNERAEKLNVIASKLLPMPDGLNQPEQLLFLSLRSLYSQFRQGTVTREQAKAEKRELVRVFVDNSADYSGATALNERHKVFVKYWDKIHDSGCPVCQGLMRVVCGLPFEKED